MLLTAKIKACSCRGIEDYYSFFKNNTTSFVGKVISVTDKEGYSDFTFEVISKLRTSFQGTVIINNKTNAAGCGIYFQKGQTYLITPNKQDGAYNAYRCSFIETPLDETFNEDTMLINLFTKKNISIDCRYFKGEIKNGKRVGIWEYYYGDKKEISITGAYVNDKQDGEWTDYSTKTYYDKGKFIKMIEIINDSANIKVVTLKNEKTMYSNDKLYKKLSKDNYSVYGSSSNIIESASVKKNGYIVGDWIIYNENGTIKEKINIHKEDNSYSAWDEFYDYRKHNSFSN